MSRRFPAWALSLCCVASLPAQSRAQIPTANTSSAKGRYVATVPTKSHGPADVSQENQSIAISIIKKLVNESESYQDPTLRVRTQARAADALWDTNEKDARDLFERAWKTAESIDDAGERSAEEARKMFMSSRNSEMILIPSVSNLRAEVLILAAQRDRALGEKFLDRLDRVNEQDVADADPKNIDTSFFDPTQPKLVIARRLELALQLLETGDIERAKFFAEPALNYATSQGIIFLCALRQKEAENADKLYGRLLAFTANDPLADATTVSLLASYAFTPNFLVTATRRGRVSKQLSDTGPIYDLSSELRTNFFNIAAKILLRPVPAPEQDRTSAGRAGTYFTIARLLPLFEQYAANYVPALNARLALLSPDAPESFRNGEEGMLKVGLVPEKSGKDDLSEILNKATSAVNSGDRDALYVNAIQSAATKGDARVREFAEKIEDSHLRGQARYFADLTAVRSALDKKDVDRGLRLIREGYLAPIHRVWALMQFAPLVKNSDPARHLQLLNEAAAEANRINVGEPERVYAFVCVALSLFEVDPLRTWDLVGETVKAANAVPNFSGEDGKLYARLRARNIVAMVNSDEPSFNMVNLFALLARDDIARARSRVDKLTSDTTRAAANLAIARSILNRPTKLTASLPK